MEINSCDGCTQPLNQTSGSLVQAPKEARPEPLAGQELLWLQSFLGKPTKDQSDNVSIDAYKLGALIIQ